MKLKAEVTGGDKIAAALKELEKKARTQAIAAAVRAGARVMKVALKNAVPVDTGASKKAFGSKTARYKSGKLIMEIIGFRKGQARQVTRTFSKRGKQRIKLTKTSARRSRDNEVRDPFFYGHLPITGRKASKGALMPIRLGGGLAFRRSARAVAPRNWMLQAYKAARAAARSAMLSAIRQALGL